MKKTFDFKFPIKGQVIKLPDAKQPPLTTPSMLNMIPRSRTNRLIGGPRHGFVRSSSRYDA